VYKVKADHEQRQRVIERIQRERADSIEAAINSSSAPR